MGTKGMNRRQFLETSGRTVAGAVAAAGTTTLLAPDGAWAMSLNVLDKHTAMTLVTVCREMYPHDNLGDAYYAACVEGLDAKAAKDPELTKTLKDGVAKLDAARPSKFVELSDGNRLKVLKSFEQEPFFQTVRGHVVVALYNNPLVWRHFGYEGPSAPYGGYVERGFDDINWLPKA